MIKVLFVCHGNICRSPMAEYLFKDYVTKKGKSTEFYIESCATSTEEIGNPVHYGTRRVLNSLGIDCSNKRARQIRKDDFNKFDYIIAMDLNNLRWLRGYQGYEKVKLLLEYAGSYRNIADPWYTGDFNETYDDIMKGLIAFYNFLEKENII
jgi:protein-tyrosine phosphatase